VSACGHDGWRAGCAECERQEAFALSLIGPERSEGPLPAPRRSPAPVVAPELGKAGSCGHPEDKSCKSAVLLSEDAAEKLSRRRLDVNGEGG